MVNRMTWVGAHRCLILLRRRPSASQRKDSPGDNLICVDFASIADGPVVNPLPAQLTGWDFTSLCPAGWEIMGGKLQVQKFPNFMGSCSFTMPATNLNDQDKLKYQSVTLSIVHRVQIDDTQQRLQVMLGADEPSLRLIDQTTGKQQRQRTMIEIARTYRDAFQVTGRKLEALLFTGFALSVDRIGSFHGVHL